MDWGCPPIVGHTTPIQDPPNTQPGALGVNDLTVSQSAPDPSVLASSLPPAVLLMVGGQTLPPFWLVVAMGNPWVSPGDGLSPSASLGKWLLWQRIPPAGWMREEGTAWGGDTR